MKKSFIARFRDLCYQLCFRSIDVQVVFKVFQQENLREHAIFASEGCPYYQDWGKMVRRIPSPCPKLIVGQFSYPSP